jgi:hypothetical protein
MHQPIQTEASGPRFRGRRFFIIGWVTAALGRRVRTPVAVDEIVKSSISIALKRLSQSFHFKTGAKQREQTPYENDSTFGRQQDIEIRL